MSYPSLTNTVGLSTASLEVSTATTARKAIESTAPLEPVNLKPLAYQVKDLNLIDRYLLRIAKNNHDMLILDEQDFTRGASRADIQKFLDHANQYLALRMSHIVQPSTIDKAGELFFSQISKLATLSIVNQPNQEDFPAPEVEFPFPNSFGFSIIAGASYGSKNEENWSLFTKGLGMHFAFGSAPYDFLEGTISTTFLHSESSGALGNSKLFSVKEGYAATLAAGINYRERLGNGYDVFRIGVKLGGEIGRYGVELTGKGRSKLGDLCKQHIDTEFADVLDNFGPAIESTTGDVGDLLICNILNSAGLYIGFTSGLHLNLQFSDLGAINLSYQISKLATTKRLPIPDVRHSAFIGLELSFPLTFKPYQSRPSN